MQAILDADFHLDGVVTVWRHAEGMHPYVLLPHHVRHPPRYCYANKVPRHHVERMRKSSDVAGRVNGNINVNAPQLDIDTQITLILLLNILE